MHADISLERTLHSQVDNTPVRQRHLCERAQLAVSYKVKSELPGTPLGMHSRSITEAMHEVRPRWWLAVVLKSHQLECGVCHHWRHVRDVQGAALHIFSDDVRNGSLFSTCRVFEGH